MSGIANHVATMRVLGAAAIALMALSLVGCSSGGQPANMMKTKMGQVEQGSKNASMASAGTMTAADKVDPKAQTCAVCSGRQPAADATGTVQMSGGKQVIAVALKDGSYTPNRFVAKAGTPTTVVFRVDGKPAKGCLSKPTFKSLNKMVNITTGEQSLDLGSLTPGTYEFTCAMGMNKAQIAVQ